VPRPVCKGKTLTGLDEMVAKRHSAS